MEITEHGAKALIVAMMQSAFQDARRLHRAGYISDSVQLTTRAMDDCVCLPYERYSKNGPAESVVRCNRYKKGINSAAAHELVSFFRSDSCREMLELFGIEVDPVECAKRAIANKVHVGYKREV